MVVVLGYRLGCRLGLNEMLCFVLCRVVMVWVISLWVVGDRVGVMFVVCRCWVLSV